MGEPPTAVLSGWGRTAATAAALLSPPDATAVGEAVRSPHRSLIARGLGRSYGDAAQSAGGMVLSSAALGGIDLDPATGLAVVGAGVSLDALLRVSVRAGWFLPVTPGTRFVSVGGAIAADVHGKNHHVDGTFGAHVAWLELVDGTGALHRLSPDPQGPEQDRAAFWATLGGMGLTGMIVRAAVRLRPVTSSWIRVDTERIGTLEALMAALRAADARHRYTVAWIDTLATGRGLGRGVITSGEHADGEELRGRGLADPLHYDPQVRLSAPRLPTGVVTRSSARAFNELWYRRAPARRLAEPQRLQTFFHPLDGIGHWNRLYGPNGFLQYQFVTPDDREDVVERALALLATAPSPAFLGVLKRFGAADPGPLSFPRPGWTLAVDLPARADGALVAVLDRLDTLVAQAGGRVYLAKDSRCRPDLIPVMYPRLPQWQAVRDRLDPDRRFASDLSRRLGL